MFLAAAARKPDSRYSRQQFVNVFVCNATDIGAAKYAQAAGKITKRTRRSRRRYDYFINLFGHSRRPGSAGEQ